MVGKRPATIQNPDQGVPAWNTSHVRSLVRDLDWDDLRALLHVVDQGSFRAAVESSRLALNTLRRRIERLEARIGTELLRRSRSGVVPTDIGQMLAKAAREMAGAAMSPDDSGTANVLIKPGEITIGCTEGLGTMWLTPRLNDLSRELSDLTISLQLDYDVARDRSAEIDVGITFSAPQRPDLVRARLATVHYMLFASEAYIRRYGVMHSLDEFRDHRFVEQSGPGLSAGLIKYVVGSELPEGFMPIRSNSALSVYWAVLNGTGIAALPTYSRAMSKYLLPLDVPLPIRFEVWYYYHVDARHSPAVRATVDWLKAAFDPVNYPWFAEHFVHPRDFGGKKAGNVVPLFEGLLDPA
ncbi:MAG: LysR family transcriptional regulator [Sphingomonas bacterium]